jgi:hypothetical protein
MKYRGWFTEQERKQIFQELRYLKNYDRENRAWRDLPFCIEGALASTRKLEMIADTLFASEWEMT